MRADQLLEGMAARLAGELIDRHRGDGSSAARPSGSAFGPQIGAIRSVRSATGTGWVARIAPYNPPRAVTPISADPNRTSPRPSKKAVWYLPCGNWNGNI